MKDAESEDETLEIQDKRKHEYQVNEKIQDMYTTPTLKTLPTYNRNMKVTATRLHGDIRTKSKMISMRKPYSSILIAQTPVGIQQD